LPKKNTKPSITPQDVAIFLVRHLAIWFCWANKQLSYKTKIIKNDSIKSKWLPTTQHQNTKEHIHQEVTLTLSAITTTIS
jgi:hypothetical protein